MANFNGGVIGVDNPTSAGVAGRRTSFTSSNPSFALNSGTTSFEALIVAGGGGYGAYAGGSGGAGGVKYYGSETGATDPAGTGSTKTANGGAIPVSAGTSIAVTVGSTGGPAGPDYGRGYQGGTSSIVVGATTYSTTGGGGGAGRRQPGNTDEPAQPGGSGGGATQPSGGATGGTGVSGEGTNGGNYAPGVPCYTGSGGGATEPGYPGSGGPRPSSFGGMGAAGVGYQIADGSTTVYYAGSGSSEGFPSNPSSNPVKNSFGRNAPDTPSNSGNPQKAGIVIISEPEIAAVANGIFDLRSVYLKVKAGEWGG